MAADLHLGVAPPVGHVDDASGEPEHSALDLSECIEVDRVQRGVVLGHGSNPGVV